MSYRGVFSKSDGLLGQILEELRPSPHPRLHDKGDRIESFMAIPAVAVQNADLVGEVRKRITRETSDPYVFVSDSNGNFQGVVPVAKVFASSVATPASACCFHGCCYRLGKDPAYGSGPIATIIQDLLSLIICFLTVSALVF